MNHATSHGSRQGSSRGGTCPACGVATHRRLLGALLPPLIITLATVTAAALILIAALIVPIRPARPSEPVQPVAASALFAGATSTPLGQITHLDLPRTPAVVDLARLIYAPGAGGTYRALLGPMLLVVEAGALTVQLDGEARLLRNGRAQLVTGNDLVLQPGDGLLLPRLTPAAFRNRGTVPAVAIGTGVFSSSVNGGSFGRVGLASWSEDWSPGATVQPLAGGWLGASAARAATLTLQRWILPAGASLPVSAHGPVDLAVETGSLTLEAHTALVWRQAAQGANQHLVPESKATLLPGDAALLQSAAEVTLRNDGASPSAILALSVELDLDDPATPLVVASPEPRASPRARRWASSHTTQAPSPYDLADIGSSTRSAWSETDRQAFLSRMTAIQHRHGLPLPVDVIRLPSLIVNATPIFVAPCHSMVSC